MRCGGSRRDWRPITGIDLHSRTSARVGRHHDDHRHHDHHRHHDDHRHHPDHPGDHPDGDLVYDSFIAMLCRNCIHKVCYFTSVASTIL